MSKTHLMKEQYNKLFTKLQLQVIESYQLNGDLTCWVSSVAYCEKVTDNTHS